VSADYYTKDVKVSFSGFSFCVSMVGLNGTTRFEKCKQLKEYQNLLYSGEIWWLKL
jgi:hypothetical protein